MSNSVRILTYNTRLRSAGMEALAQGNLDPTTSAETRAEQIAARILQSPEDYDIVCLNEVFDEDSREILVDRLQAKYPNIVVKADVDDLALRFAEVAGAVIGAVVMIALAPFSLLAAAGIALARVGLIADLLERKFEDSGLMIFSRLPFAPLPLTPEVRDLLAQAGFTEAAFPKVVFIPYEASDFDDSLAAKGVVYAQFQMENGDPLHLLASHTQADPTGKRGEHRTTRDSQFGQVARLIDELIGPGAIAEEVVFCGDLNIDGAFHGEHVQDEWRARFETPGSKFHDVLEDVWHFHQCPGLVGGQHVLPANFDRGFTLYGRDNQRLDYFLRPVQYPGRLATQHVAIAYDIAQGPPGALTANTSDHLPLKLDLNWDQPRCSVRNAEKIAVGFTHPDATVAGALSDGEMHWFRIDDPGGLGLRLEQHGSPVDVAVYGPTNLSVPLAPFTVMGEPPPLEPGQGFTRYVLPDPPYLIRVFLKDRRRKASYKLHVHRYLGTSERDAIPLLAGVPYRAQMIKARPHCLEDPSTPFADFDSMWFVTQFDADPSGAIKVLGTAQITDAEADVFGLQMILREPPHQLYHLAETPPGPGPVVAEVDLGTPIGGLLLARRHDLSFTATEFTITFGSNLSYLYGRLPSACAAPTLVCEDETDGFLGSEWGSDDIAFNLSADGRLVVHAEHKDDLDFDDDTPQTLDQWIDVIRYTDKVVFELVELDDFSPVDRASVEIPTFDEVIGSYPVDPSSETGKAHAAFRLAFDGDDGIYHLKITVSKHAPQQ